MGRSATEDRGRARRARVLLSAALLSLGWACATAQPPGPLLLHPVPPTGANYSLVQGAVVYDDPGFTVSARPWDYRLLAEEFQAAGEPNPFGDTDEETGSFLFLRIRFENRSAQTLLFNPMRSWLLREDLGPLVPLENSDLFAFADERIAEAQARGRAFRRVSFDGTVTLRPGQSLERYLVFAAPEESAKRFTLSIEDLWVGSKSHNLTFDFEAFPVK